MFKHAESGEVTEEKWTPNRLDKCLNQVQARFPAFAFSKSVEQGCGYDRGESKQW